MSKRKIEFRKRTSGSRINQYKNFDSVLKGSSRRSKVNRSMWPILVFAIILFSGLMYLFVKAIFSPRKTLHTQVGVELAPQIVQNADSLQNIALYSDYTDPTPILSDLEYSNYWIEAINNSKILNQKEAEGEFVIHFKITKDGIVKPLKILSTNKCDTCKEALFNILIKTSPWKPGMVGEIPVEVELVQPVKVSVDTVE